MKKKRQQEAFSSPIASAPYLAPPYPVEEAKLVVVRYKADARRIAELVPEPLELAEEGVVTAFIADIWQIAGPGEYHEGGVSVAVRYKNRNGAYMPYLLTSTDDALLVGREVFGMPKLLCDPNSLWIDGNARRGSLIRRGDAVLELGVNLERAVDGLPLLPKDRLFVKKVPSPDPAWPSLRQIVYQRLTGHRVRRAYTGRGWVRTGGNVAIDLRPLAPIDVIGAWYLEASWNVPAAKILLEEKL